MISGLNSTGHEIGGTSIAIFSTIAAASGAIAAAGRVRDRACLHRSRTAR
jgi:hypothetical protein